MERFVEDAPITNKRKTTDGYLVVDVRCARIGTQDYLGFELGKPTMDRVTVYRPEEIVFDRATMASFAGKPVTDDHPAEAVTSDNWTRYGRGSVGETVARDGDFIRVPMMVMDAALIDKIEAGKREISMGYGMTLDWTPGTTPDGKSYDAIMTGMRINHAAIVQQGRAGSECRVGDGAPAAWGAAPITTRDKETPKMATKMMTFDSAGVSLPIEVTDAAETVIRSLERKVAAAEALVATRDASITDLARSHTETVAAKDAEIAKLKGEALTPEKLSQLVADRAALEVTVKTVAPTFAIDAKMSNDDLRKTVVIAKFGEAVVKDQSPEAINGMFAVITAQPVQTVDTFRQVMTASPTLVVDNRQTSQNERIDRLTNAWKGK